MDQFIITASDRKAIEEGCYFDSVAANKAVSFIEAYYIPANVGKPIKLMDWQADYVRRLYGWKTKSHNRRHRKAILSTAKKSGKTILQAGILLYELFGGVQPSPFCVSASTTAVNASQVWRELDYSIRHSPKLRKHLDSKAIKTLESYKTITWKDKQARYKAFSSDAGSAEGENISALCVDELHAHESDKLYRSLEHSQVSRPDGVQLIISTAGHDLSSLWFDLFTYAQGVQAGTIIDTGILPLIFSANVDADIDDPKTWRISNPSLGISFSEDDFRKDLERAKAGGTSDLINFRRYRLNQWCRANDAYIDTQKYDRCLSPVAEHDLQGKPLYVGCDLSQTTDLCSISMVWAMGDRNFYVRNHSWACEEAVRRREMTNMPKYQAYQADGVLTISKGNVNDYRLVKGYLLDLKHKYNLKEVIFDQYNALEMTHELVAERIIVYRQPQTHKHYTSPCKDFEVAVTEGRIKHDGNRLLRWALANCRLDYDSYGNCKPSRDKSTDKIDAAVALLMAFGRAVEATVQATVRKSIYDTSPILVL
jgi:phage terminase large subunit-like protein